MPAKTTKKKPAARATRKPTTPPPPAAAAPMVFQPPATDDLRVESTSIVQDAQMLEVIDKASHEEAQRQWKTCSQAEKRVDERLNPIITAIYSAHKGLTTMRAELKGPFLRARAILDGKCATFRAEEQRKAEEIARQQEEEARAKAEKARQKEADHAARTEGPAAAAEILAEPITLPTMVVKPDLAKVEGVGVRGSWKAVVEDKKLLDRYVADNPQWSEFTIANMPPLNALAVAQHDKLAIPGVRAVFVEHMTNRS